VTEFRFEQCLGRGGFGEVYRGVMSRGGGVEVDVAIKVLRPDLDPDSQGVQRLRDEGRLLGRLTHPAILRVYDLVVIEGRAALVSEYVPGDDLGRLLRAEPIPPRAVFEIVAQVAAALDAAWSWPSVTDGKPLHLVHRDVKPDNIRVDPHGQIKLLDFGIAQAQTVLREAQTRVNTIMGSTHYLAPERLVQQEVGPESDVFALGCTLFEALAGEALFARKSMRQMYLLMVEERKFDEFVAERCASFPERLQERPVALLRAMISWRKQNRPTAAEVAARCDALSDSPGGGDSGGMTLTQWCRSRSWPPLPPLRGPLEGCTFATAAPPSIVAAELMGERPPLPEARPAGQPEPAPGVPAPDLSVPGEPVPLARLADPRADVLGETSGQLKTGVLTAVRRSVAAESPNPWAPAEMAAVITSSFGGLARIPQLLRQLPEAPEPAAAPAPRVSSTAATLLREPALQPPPTLVPVPGADLLAAAQTLLREPLGQPLGQPLGEQALDEAPTVSGDPPDTADSLETVSSPALSSPALSSPAVSSSPSADPPAPAPLDTLLVPGSEESPTEVQPAPAPEEVLMPRPDDTPARREDTASLLEETSALAATVSAPEDPALVTGRPPGLEAPADPPLTHGFTESNHGPIPGEPPEEQPTVRITRKQAAEGLSHTPLQQGLAIPPETFDRSFEEEAPTVPSAPSDPEIVTLVAPPSPQAASPAAPSRKTPRATEPRRSRRRRPPDLRWLVAWGSSMAGLVVGSVLLLFLAVAVWFTAG
jgi:hypothetical protein